MKITACIVLQSSAIHTHDQQLPGESHCPYAKHNTQNSPGRINSVKAIFYQKCRTDSNSQYNSGLLCWHNIMEASSSLNLRLQANSFRAQQTNQITITIHLNLCYMLNTCKSKKYVHYQLIKQDLLTEGILISDSQDGFSTNNPPSSIEAYIPLRVRVIQSKASVSIKK